MADVFISYKSEDRDWARKLDELIQGAGYTTWWDPSLEVGERYIERIDDELRSAKAVVVIWSERSWASAWVKEEALFARDRERLLPTRIDSVEIGVPFYTLQTIDLRDWDGDPDSPEATKLLDSLERHVPRKLRPDYAVNVYWTRFNDDYVAMDDSRVERFMDRVVAKCSSIGLELQAIKAWDHIVNPHRIADRSVYERDLNALVFFGGIRVDMFAEDVFCPGLERLAHALNPYVVHVGHDDFSLDFLDFYCAPQRKVETRLPTLPEPDTVLGDSVVEAVAGHIAFHALRVRQVPGGSGPAA